MSEHSIQSEILLTIGRLPGSIFWRNNTGKMPNPKGGGFISFGLVGSADILGCYRGRFVGIEVKTPTGRQSDQQKKFEAAIKRAGGVYVLARSVSDAVTALEAIQE